MPIEQSRRGFLSLCGFGGLPMPLVLSACADLSLGCDTGSWAIEPRAAGEFLDCFQLSVLADMADLIVEGSEGNYARGAQAVLYLDAMIGDWAGPALKARLTWLANQLDAHALSVADGMYAYLPLEIRRQVLASFDAEAFADSQTDVSIAYREFKTLLLHVHFSSEAANRDFVRVPGEYLGDLSESEYMALLRERAEGFGR